MSNIGLRYDERISGGTTALVSTGPVRPGAAERPSYTISSSAPASRQPDAIDQLMEKWMQAARQEAFRARGLVERYPSSQAAKARAAQAMYAAGEIAEAEVLAQSVFSAAGGAKSMADGSDAGLCRLVPQQESRGEGFDLPAVVAASLVLLDLGKVETVAEYLKGIRAPGLANIQASVSLAQGDYSAALEYLRGLDDQQSMSLRGYVLLCLGKPSEALRQLRSALEQAPEDLSALLNAAEACRQLGSIDKGIRYSSRAIRVAPGSREASMTYVNLMATRGKWPEIKAHLKDLRDRGVQDTSELLLWEANVASAGQTKDRAAALYERAAALANAEGKKRLGLELQATALRFHVARKRESIRSAGRTVRSMLSEYPDSEPLWDAYIDFFDRRSQASGLRELMESEHVMGKAPLQVQLHLAYLECRFSDARDLSVAWYEAARLNPRAASSAMVFTGHVDDDWSKSAQIAKESMRSFSPTAQSCNQWAFSLALAGDSQRAEKVLALTPTWDYRLEATKGLVAMSQGKLREGLRYYRKAFEWVGDSPDREIDLPLMVAYQVMALRLLGLWDGNEVTAELRAAALPGVALPSTWKDIPSFVMLSEAAARNRWGWPLAIR